MTPIEQAVTFLEAGVPLVLWTPEALRHAAATVRPPPPSKPRWLKSDDAWRAIQPELRGCYSGVEEL